ncbi:hypothetical protein D3C76_1739990 [compost metagenome]
MSVEQDFSALSDSGMVAGPELSFAGLDNSPAHAERLRCDQRTDTAIGEVAKTRIGIGA